jgi:hypothetical protein
MPILKILQRNITFTRNMEEITINTSRTSCNLYRPSDFDFVRAMMADEQVIGTSSGHR